MAARNEQIRAAIVSGMSLREIEAATGIPRSTVQRIGAAKPADETLPEPEVDEVMELVGFMLRLRPLIEKDREE